MNQTQKYDAIICGTGILQCLISGLLSQQGKKIFHIDRNPYYGGEGPSLDLYNFFKKFKTNEQLPIKLGNNQNWNIDLIPKFIMSNGKVAKILLKTKASKYLKWKAIQNIYIVKNKQSGFFSKGCIQMKKIPMTIKQAWQSDLMGIIEKIKCQRLMQTILNFDQKNPKTFNNIEINLTSKQMFQRFSLQQSTINYIGRLIALSTNDKFINLPAIQIISRIKLFLSSMGIYGASPFIYPIYGLGSIPKAFVRLSVRNGGTFMLNTDINQLILENQKLVAIKTKYGIAYSPVIICDPTYLLKYGLKNKVVLKEKIIRCICILDHPVQGVQNSSSAHITIHGEQIKRKNDIHITILSSDHCVTSQNYYIAIISTIIETNSPQKQIEVVFDIIGKVQQKFIQISERYQPIIKKNNPNGLFILPSLDQTLNLQSQLDSLFHLYKQVTGKQLNLDDLNIDEFE